MLLGLRSLWEGAPAEAPPTPPAGGTTGGARFIRTHHVIRQPDLSEPKHRLRQVGAAKHYLKIEKLRIENDEEEFLFILCNIDL